MKKTKILLSTIAVSLLVAACESTPQRVNQTAYNLTSTQESSIGTSSTNASDFSVKAAPSSAPKDNLNIPERPPEERPRIEPDKPLSSLANGKLVADFDDIPVINSTENLEKGVVEVVYKNSYNVNIPLKGQEKNGIKASDERAVSEINDILLKYGLRTANDLMYDSITESDLREEKSLIKKNVVGEMPERTSIHTYRFPDDAPVLEISERLRALPYVRTAHPIVKNEVAAITKTFLGRLNQNSSGTAPTDPFFAETQSSWWWFNQIKAFNGWSIYGSTPKTNIAIIDNGFDTDPAAHDRPNYDTNGFYVSCPLGTCSILTGLNNVKNPTTDDSSHGTEVASVAAAPASNLSGLSGIAPGAGVLPIRIDVGNTNSLSRAIYEAAQFSDIDAINLSISAKIGTAPSQQGCPTTYTNHSARAETLYATGSKNKVVVWAAGNLGDDIVNCTISNPSGGPAVSPGDPSGGGIIVGGTSRDTSHTRIKAWPSSNYNSSNINNKVIHIAAPASEIKRIAFWTPNQGTRGAYAIGQETQGTSLAAPMVTATAGMMRRLGLANGVYLSAQQIRSMLINSADFQRYSAGYSSNPEDKFLGDSLHTQFGTPKMVGVRHLNVFNALTLAKNSHLYGAIARITNSDDNAYASLNWDWPNHQYTVENFGYNAFWGINGTSTGDKLTFTTHNTSTGGYAYGYQIYRNSLLNGERFEGVSGVSGAEGNATKAVGFYGYWEHLY